MNVHLYGVILLIVIVPMAGAIGAGVTLQSSGVELASLRICQITPGNMISRDTTTNLISDIL